MDGTELVHDVQLAHVPKVDVEGLYGRVDELQHGEIVLDVIDPKHEEKGGIAAIYHFIFHIVDHVTLLVGAADTLADNLAFQESALLCKT